MEKQIRVLVVDSEKEQLSSIEKYFSSHAVIEIVETFNDGKNALNYIKNNIKKFDIIITELLLPNKDGISLISEIKKLDKNKNIIVLTGYNSLEMVKQISLYNINYFMLKPFDIEDLEKQILNTNNYKTNLTAKNKELQSTISHLLHSLGVPSHIK